jgi:hypothetical protein
MENIPTFQEERRQEVMNTVATSFEELSKN